MTPSMILITAIVAICFYASLLDANAADNKVNWKTISQGFEVAAAQRWNVRRLPSGMKPRSFEFTAIRVHLGYFEIKLVDVSQFAISNREEIGRDQDLDKKLTAFFELGGMSRAVQRSLQASV